MIADKYPANSLPVAVAAPTGMAAYNVGGTTIHRLLSLPVEHGKPADYARLHQEQLTMIRATLKNLKLVIIDEVSMVSSLTLLYIHLLLTEILSNNQPFGGVSIVCFADFLQLPPVKGNQPFEPVTLREAKQRIGSISSIPLWQTFSYDELTVNVRQHGDKEYANLLSNVRLGFISDEEYNLLNTRRISPHHTDAATTEDIINTYYDLISAQQSPVILLPRTEQCDKVNAALLDRLESEVMDLTVIDTLDTVVDKHLLPKVQKAYKKVDEDITRTAGMDKCLRVCVGARVMLKRNIDVEAGLVNGAVGVVTGFHKNNADSSIQICSVNVEFENAAGSVKIQRQTSTFEVLKSIFFTRKQFPLMLAFAITIHKSQGLSLKTAIVDVGQNSFGSGMTYVALSRVTSLNGLHLIDIARQKIIANRTALTEYNRLRTLYTPHLGCLPMPKKSQNNSPTADTLLHADSNQTTVHDGDRVTAETSQGSSKRSRKRARTEETSEDCSPASKTQKISTLQSSPSFTINIYNYCEITSLNTEFQLKLCEELNLQYFSSAKTFRTSPICTQLQQTIYQRTKSHVSAQLSRTIGDGNCLFRALSLAITNDENSHHVIRSYMVNHMLDEEIKDDMANLFAARESQQQSFHEHLEKMQRPGVWGTEQEIVSAAHLFNCSVLSFSQYDSNGQMCIQHFPPHFASNPTCINTCHHKSLYLINNGNHYERLAVFYETSAESQHHLVDVEL